MSLQNPPIHLKTYQSFTQPHPSAELLGDISMHHLIKRSSLSNLPQNIPTEELEWNESEVNRCVKWPISTTGPRDITYTAKDISHNHHSQFRSDEPSSAYAGRPSHIVSQVPETHEQYSPSMTLPFTRSQEPFALHSYQSQCQSRPPMPTPVSQMNCLCPISPASPTPIPWEERLQQQRDETPVSPPTREATVAQPAMSDRCLCSRSMTLNEKRRRNQKFLLGLMENC